MSSRDTAKEGRGIGVDECVQNVTKAKHIVKMRLKPVRVLLSTVKHFCADVV